MQQPGMGMGMGGQFGNMGNPMMGNPMMQARQGMLRQQQLGQQLGRPGGGTMPQGGLRAQAQLQAQGGGPTLASQDRAREFLGPDIMRSLQQQGGGPMPMAQTQGPNSLRSLVPQGRMPAMPMYRNRGPGSIRQMALRADPTR
jgi:hypothetical protein